MNKQNSKSPYMAFLLNLLFFGVGYIYLGKRIAFGIILIVAAVIMTIEYFYGAVDIAGHFANFQTIVDTHTASLTVIAIALAYDGYALAKKED